MGLQIEKADDHYKFGLCIYIRAIVFVVEQNVPAFPDEFNEEDNDAENFIGWLGDVPVVTARYRMKDQVTAKIERIAVLEDYRGKGLGKAIVEHLMQDISETYEETEKIVMSAQEDALPFYESMGYFPVGEEYIQGGIPHRMIEYHVEKK